MPTSTSDSQLTHFSLFALDRKSGKPIPRLPVYAEVVWLEPPPLPPPPPWSSDQFNGLIHDVLRMGDPACEASGECLANVQTLLPQALANVLPLSSIAALSSSGDLESFIVKAIGESLELASLETLHDVAAADMPALFDTTVRELASRLAIAVNALPPPPNLVTFPLGLLATDHVGYLSFDLARLPAAVRASIVAAMNALQNASPFEDDIASIRVHPFGAMNWFEALEQKRFANDSILMRLALDSPAIPSDIANLGILSMQNPGLTDWRLSPASFATNPGALVGADGCETLLPANFAQHEFNFYQVIAINDAAAQPPLSGDAKDSIKVGFVNEYRVSWIPVGHSLGQILYSFPLAPGESVNLAVIDWTRRDSALRNENTKMDESLVHELRRERVISETMNAAIKEWQGGKSFMAGLADSAGLAYGAQGLGVAAGHAMSLGGAIADSEGSRNIAVDTLQKLSENISQASAASRELNSTVVVQSAQAEHQSVETRTIVNYNHSHALTILYYEVLRHYRLVSQFVRRRPVVLAKARLGLVRSVQTIGKPRLEVRDDMLFENRGAVQATLIDARYAGIFEVMERVRHRATVASIIAATPSNAATDPGDRAFRYFEVQVLTGGMVADPEESDQQVYILGNLMLKNATAVKLHSGVALNSMGSFSAKNSLIICNPATPETTTVKWRDLESIQIKFELHNVDDASFALIRVTARDTNGAEELLVDRPYPSHQRYEATGTETLPVRSPPSPPPSSRPPEEIEDEARLRAFYDHVIYHRAHYDKAVALGSNPSDRAAALHGMDTGSGPLLEKIENRPLEMLGDFVAYPCIDSTWAKRIMDAAGRTETPDPAPMERLTTLPTRGVFAEAKLGHCNASEEIDPTRFWDWQKSPIPHHAPEIAPVQTVVPQFQAPEGLSSSPWPNSLLNIVNPPAAPDPHGMTAGLTALATANIFRDMSGQAGLTELLKKLSDNSVAIASVAQKAAAASQTPSTPTGPGGSGGQGGPSQSPNQPAPTTAPAQSPASPPPPNPPPAQAPHEKEDARIGNIDKRIDTLMKLPPKVRAPGLEKAGKDLAQEPLAWTVVLTSEWLGQGIVQAGMSGLFDGYLRFTDPADPYALFDPTHSSAEVVWHVTHVGVPVAILVVVRNPVSPGGQLGIDVPSLTLDGLHVKQATYSIPARQQVQMPVELHHTLTSFKADPANPKLTFHGVCKIDRKEIEITSEVGGGGEILGELGRELEVGASVEVLKMAVKAALKSAVKVMVNGKVGIKGTYEVLYIIGYELKQIL
jgi:hypothetical protein